MHAVVLTWKLAHKLVVDVGERVKDGMKDLL